MADPKKSRPQEEDSDDECIVEDMGSDDQQEEEEEEMEINEQVQVDFEGFGMCDNDFHGIRQMLQQLFAKDNIDISEIANLLIGQNFIGTVLKQSEIGDDESDDSEDPVFGVTSCISCNGMHKPSVAVSNLMKFLVQNCEKYAEDQKTKAEFRKILESKKEESCLGWLISERFINLPPQLSLPMFEKLQSELVEARGGKHKTCYEFSHYLMICKTYVSQPEADKKETPESLQFINSEEELFFEDAYAKFTYPLAGAAGLISGKWDEDAEEMQPCRTVLLLTKDKIVGVVEKLRKLLS